MFFSLLYFTYYGMMAVALTPNHQIAAIVGSGFYNLFNLFSGFLIFRPVSKNFLDLQKWVFFFLFQNFFPFRFQEVGFVMYISVCFNKRWELRMWCKSVFSAKYEWKNDFYTWICAYIDHFISLCDLEESENMSLKNLLKIFCAANSKMVGMVLLDMSSSMDFVRAYHYTIWWYDFACIPNGRGSSNGSAGLCFPDVWIWPQSSRSCCCYACCLHYPLCKCFCIRYQVPEFPTAVSEKIV